MSSDFPTVALGEVAQPVERPETPIAGQIYRQVGVRLWGAGAYEREQMDGADTQYKVLYRVEADDIIVNKIWARNGSVSVIDAKLAGCYVSGEFPTFEPDKDRLHPRWFYLLTKTPDFWYQCSEKSYGTSGKNRIRPEKFLEVEIPLPPLDEQRRIVAHIDAAASRIAEARGLRRGALEEAEALLLSKVDETIFTSNAELVRVEAVANSVTDGDHNSPPKVDMGVSFIFISHIVKGYIGFENCTFVSPEYYEALSPTRKPEIGDVLYTAVGSYGVPCLVDTDAPFCFQRHIAIIKPSRNVVEPNYLRWALASTTVFRQATQFATGSAQLTVPLRGIRKLQFPLPDMSEQRQVIAYLDELQARLSVLKRLQAETAAELDALLPSLLDRAFKGEL